MTTPIEKNHSEKDVNEHSVHRAVLINTLYFDF